MYRLLLFVISLYLRVWVIQIKLTYLKKLSITEAKGKDM